MKTILLVEDDFFIADIYSTKLKECGYQIKVVENGAKLLESLKEGKPDLLILDIVLPKFSGWEILEKIKNNENLKDIKIVILSNLDQKEDIEKALKLGAVKYFIKTHYTPSQLVEEIKKIL